MVKKNKNINIKCMTYTKKYQIRIETGHLFYHE